MGKFRIDSFQVTSLISEEPSNTKKGRSKRAHLLVTNVIQATENFINKAGEIANENPDIRNDLLQSMKEVKRTGNKKFQLLFFFYN
jgi:catenin alpha